MCSYGLIVTGSEIFWKTGSNKTKFCLGERQGTGVGTTLKYFNGTVDERDATRIRQWVLNFKFCNFSLVLCFTSIIPFYYCGFLLWESIVMMKKNQSWDFVKELDVLSPPEYEKVVSGMSYYLCVRACVRACAHACVLFKSRQS
jgi:hypothetical protein